MSQQNFRSILTGSFSTPCDDNPTVAMIEAAYRHHDIDARYINCDVKADGLKDAVAGARAMEWVGFNCSLPHKVAVIEHLDELAESARIIGAVNCVSIRDGRLIGDNTDGKGFLASLNKVGDPSGKKVLLLGAGGAARAIAVELGLVSAAHIMVMNRDPKKAETIAALVRDNTSAKADVQAWDGEASVPEDVDILINATSIGLGDADAMPPLKVETLRKGLIVADVIPNPPAAGSRKQGLHRAGRARDAGQSGRDRRGALAGQDVGRRGDGADPEGYFRRGLT
ncbi:shikimate dehydrogenase (NADP(+)) [Gluconobacter oxydans]|uniref:shikimate dehydrogenase (NADP(+)) n=1 Tax=Gluconobacter oxydans (strain 621H) TaxID=290633 RepID=Q5FSL3_GLUOX|nr:shikimate dehydrogenase [Gluconobacter oxydans]AAW60633.1 Shikimate 5-dehydrogenase [Gluconobacter oxydans 621H]TCW28075.1 shikimate dehydrogenase [Gluconobacter oxydans]GEC60247.1 shikimate dehydrogenase (NADP(+)) [Gluconobacter oxydans]